MQDESGLLYADQRYYNPGFGRFMTADRSNANIDYGNPTSWNRYAYTNGDPVNGMDPSGLGVTCPITATFCTITSSDSSGNAYARNVSGAVALITVPNYIEVNAPAPFSSNYDPSLSYAQAMVQQTGSFLGKTSYGFFVYGPFSLLNNSQPVGDAKVDPSVLGQWDSNSGWTVGTLVEVESGSYGVAREDTSNGSDTFFLFGPDTAEVAQLGALGSPTTGTFGYYAGALGFGVGVYGSLGGSAGGGGSTSSSDAAARCSYLDLSCGAKQDE